MQPFSICIIMKNEEKHLPFFLESIKNSFQRLPYELVMVDTGSTDKSVEIASNYTDKIYHFTWINDFSAARNFSIEKASNDWVLVLDCDEYVTSIDRQNLEMMMENHSSDLGLVSLKNYFPANGSTSLFIDNLERFFHRKNFHYVGMVHEQLHPLSDNAFSRQNLSLFAEHHGYQGSPEQLAAKADRNNTLLLKMLENTPDDPYLFFQLGQSYQVLHQYEKCIQYYGKGLEYDVDPHLQYVQMMVVGYGYALLELNRFDEALQYQNIYEEFSSLADFVCLMGLIYLRNGMLLEAAEEFVKASNLSYYHVEGSNSFLPTYNLACIYEGLGNIYEALELYKKCGDFLPAQNRITALSL